MSDRKQPAMTARNPDFDRTRPFAHIAPGATISHYHLISRLGGGGMGEVYLADDTRDNRRVAVKFLLARLTANGQFRSRFIREGQAISSLEHPNIIRVYEVDEYLGRLFIAMEYVTGQALDECLQSERPDCHRIIDWMIQVCDGLHEAHRAGIVHRDIKPANVLVDQEGRLRIVDFGLAAVRDGAKLTRTGMRLGTISYFSPEQALGKKVDHRSDIFSLGVTFYELLAGHTPFRRPSDIDTFKAIIQEPPNLEDCCRADGPAGLLEILERALEKDLDRRYQTVAEMSADLRRALLDAAHQ
jgi:serine/threonine protein kinase